MEYLVASQPYAASLPEWRAFKRMRQQAHAFELRRGRHPQEAVAHCKSFPGCRDARAQPATVALK
jgi:hypothetical protein